MNYTKTEEKVMEEKKIIEINGVKMEVDLRNCRVIENFRVGDNVKLLIKQYDSYKDSAGVIVGFDNFKERPTIIIAYLDVSYSEASIKFAYFNKDTKDIEMVQANDNDLPFKKSRVLELLDKDILKKEKELEEAKHKKDHFLAWFGKYFDIEEKVTEL